MDAAGQRRNCTSVLFYFVVWGIASSCEVGMNVSSDGGITRCHTSADAVMRRGAAGRLSQSRWRTQMALSKAVYSFQVKEDTVPGTVVGTVAPSPESLTPITYSVTEDDGENQFLLNPVSGDFLLSRRLDFESQSFYVLTVAVQQGDLLVSSVRVYFNVLDVNDNPPVFSQDPFSASLLEDTHTGTCFLTINVSDKDDGENGEVKLRVVHGDEEDVFLIHSNRSLCLRKKLDRERQSSYNLTITARDCVQPESVQLTSTAQLIVSVEDVNDNAPVFVSPGSVRVAEDTPPHSTVTTVSAVDADSDLNGHVLYYLNDTSDGKFSIDSRSGTIYLEKALDREAVDTLTLAVTAADGGSPQRSTVKHLTVHVEDVNDNDPEMSQSSYSLTVREDVPQGTSLLQVQAQDQDIGPDGQIRYMLTQASPFQVDAVRGVVTVRGQLDREKESNYTLILTAVDLGNTPRSATATISVSVLDINDFVPQFSAEILTIYVKENEEDQTQLTHQISALDEDLGLNSQLTYFVQRDSSDGLFSITPNGTLEILQSLDRERESLYIITVTAVDSGLPPLTGTLTVHVLVDDINDNHPEFTEDVYNTIVPEDSPVGTVFAMITASDIDDGDSGQIRYFMENLDVPFAIEETSGELFTTNFLDRETEAMYRLTVIGSDSHPTQPLSSSVVVTVLIGDVNDHWPQFLNSPYVAYMPADLPPGSVVCAVRAADGDTEMNADLRYSLYGPSSDLFLIDPSSGTVFTSKIVQRVNDTIINVHVEDAGETPKFDVTTISVRSQNKLDFPAMSVDVLSHSLSEEAPIGMLVAVISAESIRAQPVSFYLTAGDSEEMFHVDSLTGVLTVENPLDYENIKEFSLLVEARDAGLPPFSTFAELHIAIADVNDNVPQFTQEEYSCDIYENSPPSILCDVLAVDADSGDYGTVHYNITEGNSDHFFTIDHENGLLSTTVSLDREDIAQFNLTVEATELENPLHKDRATIIVTVLDRNDNAPRFSQVYFTEVPEDIAVGRTIIRVTSSDDDTDSNAFTNYSIFDDSDDIRFNVDFTTGDITVVSPLDREEQDYYILRVNANDSAWSVSTDVTIIVSDVNDNRPVFSDPFYSVVLHETTHADVFVVQVLATDADAGKNSKIFYYIEPSNEEFWVNASSGEIYTKQPLMLLDAAFEIYQFTVVAYDCGNIPLYSNATVMVRLEPYNHHPPTFLPFLSPIAIPYDLPLETELVDFIAIDPDANSSAGVEYTLNGGNASDFFWIDPYGGQLFLNVTLMGRDNLTLTLFIAAKDQGFPSLTSQTEVTFQVTGRNQYFPSFSEPDVNFSVPEDLPVGSVIGRVQAEDGDYGSNGVIKYCIDPENQYLPFSVGEHSGLLTLMRELDYETERFYHFQIKAIDGGWFSKTGMVKVTVRVMDINDNAPVFSSSEYVTSVPENSKLRTNVINMKAIDIDSGVNGLIIYSLIAGRVDKFEIDPRNGTITTLDILDFEQETLLDVTVKASNYDVFTQFSLAHVVIHISDINEFTPTFKYKEFNFSVLRNVRVGDIIGTVTATDHDGGSAGQVFYLMFGQNKNMGFKMNELSGEIYTTRSLRKQGNSQIVLKVLAKNAGVVTSMNVDEALVQISVIDVNDPPIFTSALYEANVTEDSPTGTAVITVSAVDEDSILDWNRFFFNIESGNTNFSYSVDPSSGVISVSSPLDRELWEVYNLTVTATDNGSPPATGTTYVVVVVSDINDNAPKLRFSDSHVKENQPEGVIVAELDASDSDLPPNQGPFTYWLANLSNAFSLTSDGVLLTTRSIDREQNSLYRLLVVVRDAGFPSPLSSTAMFYIKVTDENDNPPLSRNIFIEVKYFGSSFQGGVIGSVHPEDPDKSDTFSCSIKSGSMSMFTILNGTCELWSSSFQGEATFNVTVEATDQLHFPVNNSIYINYKGFTNASIDSCILFYVSCCSMEEFLSNKYLRFVKALDSLFNLQASKTHVFGIKHIGNDTLLLAAVKNYNGQYVSREIARSISAGHRKLLEAQSNMTISHISSDPCFNRPCQNGATCNKNIYISQEVSVLESVAVIFVSPQKEIFNCTCPVGFTGSLCEDDLDECETNPCQNEGTCVNTAGGFYCHCQEGFTGSVCSADLDECLRVKCQNGGTCIPAEEGYRCHCQPGFEGAMCEAVIDHCGSAPCLQGSCTNSLTGFSCNCPFGVGGVRCEEPSFGFQELSFMEFPPLDRRTNLISLKFATVQKNSLLIYNPGGSSSREFFALEILDGTVRLSYDLGTGPVRLHTHKKIADGRFHSVVARRIGSMGSLHVDNCTEDENSGFCFSKSEGFLSEWTLDVGSSNMILGGLKTAELILLHSAHIQTHDFVGCIRNIQINGILLKPSMALATHNILASCPRAAASPCHSLPCKNGGECHDLWSDYICQCIPPFTGRDCGKALSEQLVLRLNGSEYIEYVVREKVRRDNLMNYLVDNRNGGNFKERTVIDIKFKTKDDGVLMIILEKAGLIMLAIKDRKPVCISKDSQSERVSEVTGGRPVADGMWHILSLFSSEAYSSITMDGDLVLNHSTQSMTLTPASVEKIILGRNPPEETSLQPLPGFTGCVQYFNLNGYTLPFNGRSAMLDVWPSWTLRHHNCSSLGVCLRSATHNRSCVCLHNVTHHVCDICAPTALSRGQCSETQSGEPLWLIAVVLPLIALLLLVMGVCVCLLKVRPWDRKCQRQNVPQKAEQGTDNGAFWFDAASQEEEKPHDLADANQQRSSVEIHCDGSLQSVQPTTKSELEYYEVGSICSAFHSDSASMKLSWHKHLYNTKHLGADPRLKGNSNQDKSLLKPRDAALQNKLNTQHPEQTLPCCMKSFLQPELLEPIQCLTFEEISQLNTPLEKTMLMSSAAKSNAVTALSSEGGTNSLFTCSQSGQRQEILRDASQDTTHSSPLADVFVQWEDILNLYLPYSSYAPVFQDIARLPDDFSHISDMQSDIEEII